MHALLFEVADRRFAVPARVVEHIAPLVEVAPIPGAPDVVEGAIDLRGQIVPVFGLRRRFALPERAAEIWDHLIIAHAGSRLVAIHVDRVLDFTEFPPEAFEPVERVTSAAPGVGALARTPSGVLLVHDPATFLTDDDAEALDRALGLAPGVAPGRPGALPEASP